ncbi:unnamed protein product [Protopolystoma xenopodis]|uniref:WD repeat domain-containing protein 83 n=1 Tax=Protopolystoma xenopodis TaxID=117903 RepID=A0A448WE40_9PLAT|nr:unnamed protein product [Protopolystoma xenopodis]
MHEAKDSVNCLAVNKWQIVTGSVDRCIRIYDIRKGQLTEDFVGFPITSISLSIDAQCVLVGCQDSTIRLFDALTGDLLNKFSGHKNTTYRVDSTLMNYDAHVVSGSEDSDLSVLIWDLVRGGTEALICLSHSLNGPAFSARLTNSTEPVSGLARAAASASASAGSLFVHSISPHPKECRLLTAAGDYIWLWSSETEESTT